MRPAFVLVMVVRVSIDLIYIYDLIMSIKIYQ
jgi:hypothetical protein